MSDRQPSNLAHYVAGNEGHWLTLVHGGLVGASTWRDCVDRLSSDSRVLTYDQAGYGESPVAAGPYGVREAAEDLIALWDRLEISSSFLGGFSLGGAIAQEAAKLAPERVEGLILVSTTASLSPAEREGYRTRAEMIESAGVKGSIDALIERAFSPGFIREQPEVTAAYAQQVLRTPAATVARSLRAIAEFENGDGIGEIECPTVVICGAEDPGLGPEHAERLRRGIAKSALAALPNVGHTVHLEARSAFCHIVGDFVGSGGTDLSVYRPIGTPEAPHR